MASSLLPELSVSEGGNPPVPTGATVGLVVAGLLVVTIAILLVILGAILMSKPQRPKSRSELAKTTSAEDRGSTLEYNYAYERGSNTGNINTSWNQAYCIHDTLHFEGGSSRNLLAMQRSYVNPVCRQLDMHKDSLGTETDPTPTSIPLHDANDYEELP